MTLAVFAALVALSLCVLLAMQLGHPLIVRYVLEPDAVATRVFGACVDRVWLSQIEDVSVGRAPWLARVGVFARPWGPYVRIVVRDWPATYLLSPPDPETFASQLREALTARLEGGR